MNKFLFLFIITNIFCNNISNSQVNVGSIEYVKLKPGVFESEDLLKLKSSKTIFIYRLNDNLEELKRAINEIWTITEISFIPFSEIDKIDFQNSSIFSLSGLNTEVRSVNSNLNYDNSHIYLNLWMYNKNKKGKNVKKTFSRIELHPTFIDYSFVTSNKDNNTKVAEYLYTKATLKNWNVGFLKNYLQNVNDLIEEGSNRWLYQSDNKNQELKKLAKTTLYIPEYVLTKFNKFTGDESEKMDQNKLFNNYPYKYKVISAEDISLKITESEEPIYYLVYVKSSTDKYVSIVYSKTGSIIYNSYKTTSYNISKSDIKSIASSINSFL
jgi:hypothetical protein